VLDSSPHEASSSSGTPTAGSSPTMGAGGTRRLAAHRRHLAARAFEALASIKPTEANVAALATTPRDVIDAAIDRLAVPFKTVRGEPTRADSDLRLSVLDFLLLLTDPATMRGTAAAHHVASRSELLDLVLAVVLATHHKYAAHTTSPGDVGAPASAAASSSKPAAAAASGGTNDDRPPGASALINNTGQDGAAGSTTETPPLPNGPPLGGGGGRSVPGSPAGLLPDQLRRGSPSFADAGSPAWPPSLVVPGSVHPSGRSAEGLGVFRAGGLAGASCAALETDPAPETETLAPPRSQRAETIRLLAGLLANVYAHLHAPAHLAFKEKARAVLLPVAAADDVLADLLFNKLL